MEGQVAQQLFGVDMVSVVEQIKATRRAEALGLEGDWRATTSDGKSSVDGSSEIGSGRAQQRALKSLRTHLR